MCLFYLWQNSRRAIGCPAVSVSAALCWRSSNFLHMCVADDLSLQKEAELLTQLNFEERAHLSQAFAIALVEAYAPEDESKASVACRCTFWCRRCTLQSRSYRCTAPPCESAKTCKQEDAGSEKEGVGIMARNRQS